jgi:iron(III) transport system substrate-binding protein
MRRLAKQQLTFHSNGTLEVNLVAAGELPIAIDTHADSAAEIRDRGAPIGITVLKPHLVKSHGLFLPRNAPHPFAALLYHDWLLSAEGQTVSGKNIGRTIARRDVPVRHPEFQVDPDCADP